MIFVASLYCGLVAMLLGATSWLTGKTFTATLESLWIAVVIFFGVTVHGAIRIARQKQRPES